MAVAVAGIMFACSVCCAAACDVPATAVSILMELGAGTDCGDWLGSTHATMAMRITNALKVCRRDFCFMVFSRIKISSRTYMSGGIYLCFES
jgi:hypothetical protein